MKQDLHVTCPSLFTHNLTFPFIFAVLMKLDVVFRNHPIYTYKLYMYRKLEMGNSVLFSELNSDNYLLYTFIYISFW